MQLDQDYTTPLLINNEEVLSSKTFPVSDPATGKLLWSASAASLSDVASIAAAASAAFPAWSRTKYTRRRELIQKFQRILERRQAELKECMRLETGAGEPWRDFNVRAGIELLEHIAGTVVTIAGSIEEEAGEGRAAYVTREPYGVILSIVPWNAPVILLLRAIFFPVATGNTVVVKASETSPRTHFLVTSIAVEAGFPPGVINLVSHSRENAAEITNALIAHEAVRKIDFTGSSMVARKLAAKAGEHLKPISLELGGKAPLIVLEDADVDAAAAAAAAGSFVHSGQVCMATEKILVHSAVIEQFTAALVAAAHKHGEFQILALPGANRRVKALVDDALEKGATIANRDIYSAFDFDDGNRFPNLVLSGVTEQMELYHVESFGPLASITEIADEEEAVRLANDTIFGLVSAVWTKDLARGLRISKRIDAGVCNINGPTFLGDVNLFPPGWKASGTGNLVGRAAFDEFMHLKITTFGI